MLTFFEFYETLLGFVMFKLYGELGIRYPLQTVATTTGGEENVVSNVTLHPTLGGKATSVLAANLSALQMALHQASQGNSAVNAIKDAMQQNVGGDDETGEDGKEKKTVKELKAEKKRQKELMQSVDEALKGVNQDEEDDDDIRGDEYIDDDEDEDQVPIAAPLREALEAISDGTTGNEYDNGNFANIITSQDAKKRHQLFHNLTFFLSREVPRGYLELIILSFGGQVGWEGQDSPIAMDDASITHHVVDRPALLASYEKLPKSREYIQPQWILDSANFNFVLPITKYGVGKELPPHLSPWVEDKEEGYVPKYREEVEALKNGEVLEDADSSAVEVEKGVVDSEGDESSEEEEIPSHIIGTEKDTKESGSEEGGSEDEEEEDEEADAKAATKKQTEVSWLHCLFAIFVSMFTHFIHSLFQPTHRTMKLLNLPKHSCPKRQPVSTEGCNTALLKSKPRLTICTRNVVRLSLLVRRARMASR